MNNAGFGSTAPLLQADVDQLDRMIAVNVTAPTRLTAAVAPAFAKRKCGTIVNISSTAVLPGATATEFWDLAGTPVSAFTPDFVMPADAMVDAALAGLDQGELITIRALPNTADLDAYEAARQVLMPNLSRSTPAERYALPV